MMNNEFIDIFIPSYKRANNLKTVKYFTANGYEAGKIHVVIDSEADDKEEYEKECERYNVNLYVYNIDEARVRYDFVHRPSPARRAAGMARNMIYDIARNKGIKFYIVQDDDTQGYEVKRYGKYCRLARINEVVSVFNSIKRFMEVNRIGLFGLSQTGDYIGGAKCVLYQPKVMNTTFVNVNYIYAGERGVQDNDTSMFTGVLNEGYFTGQLMDGVVLKQTQSATAEGGLTDLYKELKLLNKALVTVIQYPSAIIAEKQKMNGGRLHHRINYRYLMPKILKMPNGRSNIAWDTYPEDGMFTNEPKLRRAGNGEI